MYVQPQGQGRFPGPPHPQQPQYQVYPPQPIPAPQYRQAYQGNMNAHGQPYMPPPDMQNGQRGSHAGATYQNMGKNAALMQPPSLNVDEPIDSNSQFFQQQRGPMTMSNNQHSQFDTYHQGEEQAMWTQQAQIASMFWEQRCMTMLERFEWFFDRFQILKNDHTILSEEMQKMDSEEEWHIFQQHHEEFHQKIEEMEQELSAVLGQNEQLLQQRRNQDSEGVWQQRYQQLLGNFKSLQEQMAHMQSSGGRTGVPPEQYRQLEEHCAQLEYQYQQAYNELKMHKDGAGINPNVEGQMSAYLEEIQSYKEKLNSLHSQNVELQKMLQDYEAQGQQLQERLNRTLYDRNKYEDLVRQVELKEQQIRSLQDEFKKRSLSQTASSQLQRTVQEKNQEIQQLRRTINVKVAQLAQATNAQGRLEQQQTFNRVKAEQQRKILISQYQQKLSELRLQVTKNDQSSKIQNLQKKLAYSNQEIVNLNDTLKKKNQELIQLRSLTYEIEKLKEAQAELMRASDERDRLADSLRKKTAESAHLLQEVQRLSHIINELNSRRQEYSTRNLRLQIEDLTDQLSKNEAELNRLRSILTLKEDYASKLEDELRQSREKTASLQQLIQTEREGWHEKEVRLSSKTHDYSDRIRALDYEFNLQMKDTLEKEVNSLRKINAERQEAIRALQQKELILQSQLSVYQKQEENHNKDLSLQKEKQRSLLASIETQAKRFKELEAAIKRKDEEIILTQQRHKEALEEAQSLHLQIEEHQSLIKAKSKSIKELQEQLNLSIARQSEHDKLALQNARLQMTVQTLEREKKAQQESPLAKSKGLSVNKSTKQLESRENVISQLWNENEYLKGEIANLIKTNAENSTYPKESKLVPVDLNRRLNEFNQRLHLTITSPSNPGGQLSRTESQKTVLLWEKERAQLIDHYEAEINSLKQQLHGRKVTGSQISSHELGNSKKVFMGGLQSETLREQIAFLKQKSQELEERNKQLIGVNEDLRVKIDSMLKLKQNNATLNYYKQQLQRAQIQKDALKEKIRKANEELKDYKLELAAKNTKLSQQHDFKVMQLQLILQEQVRKISLLQGEKTANLNDKATLQHDKNIKSLSKNQSNKNQQIIISDNTPKSNQYKLGIQQQFGSVLGNLSGYDSPKGSVIGASGVRVQGRQQYRNYDQ